MVNLQVLTCKRSLYGEHRECTTADAGYFDICAAPWRFCYKNDRWNSVRDVVILLKCKLLLANWKILGLKLKFQKETTEIKHRDVNETRHYES